MMRTVVIGALLLASCQSASATTMSGGELLAAPETLGLGFVSGASDALFSFDVPELGPNYAAGQATCGQRAGLTVGVVYDLVITRLKADPSLIAMPASFAVATILQEICS